MAIEIDFQKPRENSKGEEEPKTKRLINFPWLSNKFSFLSRYGI